MDPILFENFARASDALISRKKEDLVHALNFIIAKNWILKSMHWSKDMHPFHDSFGIIFARTKASLIGFSIYKKISTVDKFIVYLGGLEVDPAYHGRGILKNMIHQILENVQYEIKREKKAYLSWRTRNPIVLNLSAKLCGQIFPYPEAVQDEDLLDVIRITVNSLYAGQAFDEKKSLMPGCYAHIEHRPQMYSGHVEALANWIDTLAPQKQDGLVFAGRLA